MFYGEFLLSFFVIFMVSVLHINNIAGTAGLISNQQRKMGMNSDVLVFSKNQFDFGYDFLIESKKIRKILDFWKIAKKYDVLHFHYKSVFRKGREKIAGPVPYFACFFSLFACFFSLSVLVAFFLISFLVSLDFPICILMHESDLK